MSYPDVRVSIDFTSPAFAEATDWVDVTGDVVDIDTEWGRSSLVDEFQPGGGSLTLRSFEGQYDPSNESGPHYGNLRPRSRIKVEASIVDEVDYSDDFEDASIGSEWTTSGDVSEAGGELVVTSPASIGSSVATLGPLDFTDRHVTADVDLDYVASISEDAWPLIVRCSNGDYFGFYVRDFGDGMMLIAQVHAAGAGTHAVPWASSPAIPYDDTAHRWMRLRHHGTLTSWQVSPDGETWTTMMVLDVAWGDLENASIACEARCLQVAFSDLVVSWNEITVQHELVHPISYGWLKGWPTRQTFRTQQHVDLEWDDALAVLGTAELAESVWDYRIAELGPTAWYRLDDDSDVAEDRSGNGHHARWSAYGGITSPAAGTSVPPSVMKAGRAESVIRMSNAGATSWAKMLAELGQPVSLPDPPRSVSVVTPPSLGGLALDRSFTVELWLRARQAFPIDVTSAPSSTTPIRQALVTFGGPGDAWLEIGIHDNGNLYVGRADASMAWGQISFPKSLVDGLPHHAGIRFFASGSNLIALVYIDGLEVGNGVNLGAMPIPASPPVIGQSAASTAAGGRRSLQSVVGDVLLYDRTLSVDALAANYRAGHLGTLSLFGTLIGGAIIVQALEMAGWEVPHRVQPDVIVWGYPEFNVDPGVLDGRKVIDFCRSVAASGQELFYMARDGALELVGRGWQHQLGRAAVSQARFGDDAASTIGYSQLDFDFDTETVVNDVRVRWRDGEQRAVNEASVEAYGPLRDTIDTRLTDPADALAVAWWRANTRGQPRRIVSHPLHLQPTTAEDFDAVLRLDHASRVTLVRTTPDDRELTQDYWVQAIRHRIQPGEGEWDTYLTLEPADVPGAIFRLDLSDLDSTDVLAL